MRTKQSFDKGWKYIIGEIGPFPKTYRKSGMIGGLTNSIDGELFEPFAGAVKSLQLVSEMFPMAEDDSDQPDFDLSSLFFANLPESAKALHGWKDIDLPHDFRLEMGYKDDPENWVQGYIPNGVAYYRKTFKIPESDEGKRIVLEFDGVMRNASFWYNGCFIGDHYSGYTGFQFDITELTKYGDKEGDNVLLVRCDTTGGDEGWWYEGGGLYRHTWLTRYSSVHIGRWGVYVNPKINGTSATLIIDATVVNETFKCQNIIVRTTVYDPDGKDIGSVQAKTTVTPIEESTVKCILEVTDAKFWGLREPNIYIATTEVITEGEVVDSYDTEFGIRSLEYTSEGLLLNGELTPLYGACVHQDFACVGVAVPDAIQLYKVQRLKDMGLNSYRSSHHSASNELLDACDRLGMLVMNENRIIEVTNHRMEDLKELILSGRNHPSVFAWSLSNEELFSGSYQAVRILNTMIPYAKLLDDTRFYVSAEAMFDGETAAKYIELFDIFGINYAESSLLIKRFKEVHDVHPEAKLLNTENTSWFTTRAIYEDNKERGHCSSYGTRFAMMGGEGGENAGGTAKPAQTWNFFKQNPYTGGFFIWTGFDYRGETTPLRNYQVSSNFGVMDTCGFPKDDYFFYQSKLLKMPLLHIMPHWSWNKEGEIKQVRLYTNCDEVELIHNGESLGKKPLDNDWIQFEIPFKKGRLEAIGFIAGKEVVKAEKLTAGVANEIILTVNRHTISANGNDVACVTASVVDEKGVTVPTAENFITFTVAGAGSLLGLGNGDPSSRESDKSSGKRAFGGLLLALIQSNGTRGDITVRATSPGLLSGNLIIKAELIVS